jgi:hypothetical protein
VLCDVSGVGDGSSSPHAASNGVIQMTAKKCFRYCKLLFLIMRLNIRVK